MGLISNNENASLVAWSRGSGARREWELNPEDKLEMRKWTEMDQLCVIRCVVDRLKVDTLGDPLAGSTLSLDSLQKLPEPAKPFNQRLAKGLTVQSLAEEEDEEDGLQRQISPWSADSSMGDAESTMVRQRSHQAAQPSGGAWPAQRSQLPFCSILRERSFA